MSVPPSETDWPDILYRVTSSQTYTAGLNPPFRSISYLDRGGILPRLSEEFPNSNDFKKKAEAHLNAKRIIKKKKKFSTPFVSVTSSLRYAIAVAHIHTHHRNSYRGSVHITVIDAKKLTTQTKIWCAKTITRDLGIHIISPSFEPSDEYLIFGEVTGPPGFEILPFHESPYSEIAIKVQSMVPGIGNVTRQSTFSDFWSRVPQQNDPGRVDTRNALALARAFCGQASSLWIPLMLHILCLPNFFNWDDKLVQRIVDGAYNVVIGEPGGLEGFYRKVSTATYERARDGKVREIPIFDFLGKSVWRPPNDECATKHVLFASRAIKSIGDAFYDGLAKKLQEQCNISVVGHVVSASATGKPRAIIRAADRGQTLHWADQSLGHVYIQLKDAFSQQKGLSLGWLKDQLLASESKTKFNPSTKESPLFWQIELAGILNLIEPKKRKRDLDNFSEQIQPESKTPRCTEPVSSGLEPGEIPETPGQIEEDDAHEIISISSTSDTEIGTHNEVRKVSVSSVNSMSGMSVDSTLVDATEVQADALAAREDFRTSEIPTAISVTQTEIHGKISHASLIEAPLVFTEASMGNDTTQSGAEEVADFLSLEMPMVLNSQVAVVSQLYSEEVSQKGEVHATESIIVDVQQQPAMSEEVSQKCGIEATESIIVDVQHQPAMITETMVHVGSVDAPPIENPAPTAGDDRAVFQDGVDQELPSGGIIEVQQTSQAEEETVLDAALPDEQDPSSSEISGFSPEGHKLVQGGEDTIPTAATSDVQTRSAETEQKCVHGSSRKPIFTFEEEDGGTIVIKTLKPDGTYHKSMLKNEIGPK